MSQSAAVVSDDESEITPRESTNRSQWGQLKEKASYYIEILLRPLIFRVWTTCLSVLLFVIVSCLRKAFGLTVEQNQVVAVTTLMISLWVFQSIPLAATSLIPIFAFPLFGIMSGSAVSKEYINATSMIFIGGFIFALAIERWRLHVRIALFILSRIGSSLPVVLLGSMSIAYAMSMWLSNTATCLILMPNIAAIVSRLKSQYSKDTPAKSFLGIELGLYLGIAFSSNIGGIATPIGTPPNLIFAQQYEILFPGKKSPTFLQWIALAGPISFIFLIFLYFYLLLRYVRTSMKNLKFADRRDSISAFSSTDDVPDSERISEMRDYPSSMSLDVEEEDVSKLPFTEQYKRLGRMSYEEIVVTVMFILLIILWSTRAAWQKIPLFKKDFINDGMIAVGLGFILFLIPARNQDPQLNNGEYVSVMDWSVMTKFPWDIIFLFGAGFSISAAFSGTELNKQIVKKLVLIESWHPIFIVLVATTAVTFCTEVVTNIAAIIVFLPILAAIAQGGGFNPLLVLIPATISSSYAFMLPIGTAPNMIAFKASPSITINKMMSAGLWLNFFAIALTTAVSYLLIPVIYKNSSE